ncbi:alkylation response protein AidB-like acyl-CoA dehydrogenase [Azospirillum fermentarium]|nr:alkylation response protein AidB-like acyl-CoA dehydrogenase [Azospirillum fermentarium]
MWRLSGRKRFATGCEGLAWSTVSAVTDEPEPRVGLFIVSHGTPGITIVRHVVFENAVTAVEQVLAIVGNAGVSRDHPFERHHRNVVCARTHAPAAPLIRAAAARAALAGRPGSRVENRPCITA